MAGERLYHDLTTLLRRLGATTLPPLPPPAA